MENKVLLISRTETFTIKGLEMKIRALDVEVTYSGLNVKDLGANLGDNQLILLYTDEDISDAATTLVLLKDHCLENNKRVIVIGTKIEYEAVGKVLPPGVIESFYERPLQMEKLLDEIEKILSEEAEIQQRRSVLIVDDDVQYMTMIMDWLKDSYRVSMANSGVTAITWLATNHADLILLDYEMPVTSGPQVLEMLRSNPDTANIPVMFLTGNNDRDSIVKVVSLRPVDYLLKAIDRKGLHDKIDNYFKKVNP